MQGDERRARSVGTVFYSARAQCDDALYVRSSIQSMVRISTSNRCHIGSDSADTSGRNVIWYDSRCHIGSDSANTSSRNVIWYDKQHVHPVSLALRERIVELHVLARIVHALPRLERVEHHT